MKGLKKYSHRDRQKIIAEIVPLVRKKFGKNLIALAATGSFARNDDSDYSDLELTAFVKKMPKNNQREGIGKIRNGLLIELVWMTKETYLASTLEVTGEWYLAASDVLLPVINEEFIRELKDYKVKNLKRKCLIQAVKNWHEVQEATGKVLTAVAAENRDGIPLLLFDMLRHMLIILSFLNQTPFVTFARFISQARTFELKPKSFDSLADLAVTGSFQDLQALENNVTKVFSEFENIFEKLGIELYDRDINLE